MVDGKDSRKADKLLQALMTHRTIAQAAKAAGLSERTAYDYLSQPQFQARYRQARDDVIRGLTNHLRERMNEAVDVIGEIMTDPENKAADRLSAAKAILDYKAKYNEQLDVLERLTALESQENS